MDNKISKTFLITDTHFSHSRIITHFGFRPKNFNQLIINNWKNTVKNEDIIFHLGDVTWGSQEELKNIMNDLPGTKILIKGNHDRNHSNNWFIKAGFSAVLEKAQISGIILSHMPSLMHKEEIERDIINIFGHFHDNSPDRWEGRFKERITDNHYLLSLEEVNYTPISIENAKKRKFIINAKKRIKEFDISNVG